MTITRDIPALVENLISKLKRRQVIGSWSVSTETLLVLRQVISVSKWNNVRALLDDIAHIGHRLVTAQPQELAVGNIVRRVLHMIREEYKVHLKELEEDKDGQNGTDSDPSTCDEASLRVGTTTSAPTVASMFTLMGGIDFTEEAMDYSRSVYTFKPTVIQEITEMIDELVNIYSNIAGHALEQINSSEIIMTSGKSRTVIEFLKAAARERQFQVIVVDSSSKEETLDLAKSLVAVGITTTIVPHAAIFAIMSKVNKVILGTHAVMANGGLIAVSGTQSIAAAAHYHSTPVVVLTGLYKLSPLFPMDHELLNICVSPSTVTNYADGDIVEHVEVVAPYFDYVAPELVSLFITNVGGHPPSYLYRLITENYDPIDSHLEHTPHPTL
ncbi:GCD complex subunit gcd7 [Entomophthora muscae]|uniref:GCD complex subunit gcd7 n=2 Tax=Entomophthora muscae TaxID=34485 RepID=A0ACC2TFP8_9FUNG|nr:GCD complex subunit gcd7 [Entomophthora muscae]